VLEITLRRAGAESKAEIPALEDLLAMGCMQEATA
jgi:hypothetical protein